MKRLLVFVIVLIALLGLGAWWAMRGTSMPLVAPAPTPQGPTVTVIGTSVEGRPIEAYTFGKEGKHVLFVGGIHGGYEWNSVLLAYKVIDYLKTNPDAAAGMTVTVIPSANPDGVFAVVGKEGLFSSTDAATDTATLAAGRFNANKVDLNRNFACKWQATSTWRSKSVSAGTAAFSEPETQAIRNFVTQKKPDAVVFWHSQANAVYASECEDGILPQTHTMMETYARAADYPAILSFDAYPVTGDAEGWLASVDIPAITVELSNHTSVEWEKNLAGTRALFDLYRK